MKKILCALVASVTLCQLMNAADSTTSTTTTKTSLADTLKMITPPASVMPPTLKTSTSKTSLSAMSASSAEIQSFSAPLTLWDVLPKYPTNNSVQNSCGTSLYTSYNLPPFTNSAWHTFSSPSGYDWSLSYNNWVTPTNAPSYGSYVSANYPLGQVQSSLWIALSNDYDQYGDPKAHLVSFWYQYFLAGVFMSEAVVVGTASTNAHVIGGQSTNLPPSSTWRRVTLPVAASQFISGSCLQATVFKGNAASRGGPTAYIDVVSWCAIDTPMPESGDIQAKDFNENVLVAWNTQPYTRDNWYLVTRTNLALGSWVSNTIPISYTNNDAYVIISRTNSAKFFRLRHK